MIWWHLFADMGNVVLTFSFNESTSFHLIEEWQSFGLPIYNLVFWIDETKDGTMKCVRWHAPNIPATFFLNGKTSSTRGFVYLGL